MTGAKTQNLLARMLEESSLVTRVRELDAPTLYRVVRHIGLEDAGEIVALASSNQLRDVFDEDLWVSAQPGRDESFDADRFALWLEILLESGEGFVADKLTELPEDLVTLGFQRQVLVIDIDALAVEMSERHRDVDLVEKALESCLYEEIDEFRIIARTQHHWDAIIAVLLALDSQHHDCLHRLLERCCHASTEYIEDNGGLYEVLSTEEMLESDAAAEREERRAIVGYVAPSDAASFLGLPRVMEFQDLLNSNARDPVTRAHFRSAGAKHAPRPSVETPDRETRARTRFGRMLEEAGVIDAPPVALLPPSPSDPARAFQRAITSLRRTSGETHAERMEELAYLTNVLVAGSSFAGHAFRPVEAAEAAIATCNLGLEYQKVRRKRRADEIVRREPADRLFLIGWHLIFWGVSMPALEQLNEHVSTEFAKGPISACDALRRALDAKKPWWALPILERHDLGWSEHRVALFEHLLDRFPTLPAHGSSGPALSFFATMRQLEVAKNS